MGRAKGGVGTYIKLGNTRSLNDFELGIDYFSLAGSAMFVPIKSENIKGLAIV